jgi:hypothetical protein
MDEMHLRQQIQQIEEVKQHIQWATSDAQTKKDEIVSAILNLRKDGLYVEIVDKVMTQYLGKANNELSTLLERMRKQDWKYLDNIQRDLESILNR